MKVKRIRVCTNCGNIAGHETVCHCENTAWRYEFRCCSCLSIYDTPEEAFKHKCGECNE